MKITIKADGERDNDTNIILTNETLDNPNYVELVIGETEYMVNIKELYQSTKVFESLRLGEVELTKYIYGNK